MKWIFVPFATLEYEGSTRDLVASYQAEYKTDIKVIYKSCFDRSSLEQVGNNETLIVVGHGNVDQDVKKSDKLGVREGSFGFANKTRTIVTANELASMLHNRKLPKSHFRIKTTSCCGGGLARAEEGAIGPIESPCFASVLARAMFLAGYVNIMVGGYPGYVMVGAGHKKGGIVPKHNAKTITVRGQNTVGDFPHKADPVEWPEFSAQEAHLIWYSGQTGLALN